MSRISIILACLATLSLSACGEGTDCTTTADCFQGESCIDGACGVADTNNGGNNGANNGANNGTSNNGTANNGSTNNGGTNNGTANNGTTNNGTANNGVVVSECVVQIVGNSCEDDEFEQNDSKNQESTPLENLMWCTGEDLVPTASFSGKLCPGDPADMHRIVIDNRIPNQCLQQQWSTIITITLDAPCPDLLDIRPYTFFQDPVRVDLCEEDENVNCRWESPTVRVIEWLRTDESQILDTYLLLSPTQNNIAVGYTVKMDVYK